MATDLQFALLVGPIPSLLKNNLHHECDLIMKELSIAERIIFGMIKKHSPCEEFIIIRPFTINVWCKSSWNSLVDNIFHTFTLKIEWFMQLILNDYFWTNRWVAVCNYSTSVIASGLYWSIYSSIILKHIVLNVVNCCLITYYYLWTYLITYKSFNIH